ncbi:MAG: TrkA family potassium uptake protein [Dehalococcoidia bacterium]|nr:TrkA family potassium uptake protein [Dehalococcoidia bacterium]
MRKQVAVIGLGRFGSRIATTLHDAGHDVLAIDLDEKRVQEMAAHVTHAVQADATRESVLTELGLPNFEAAVVAMGSAFESSVLCTILLRKIGVTYVIARADHDLHGSILERIGANRVVYPEQEMGARVAHEVVLRAVRDYMPLGVGQGISSLMSPKYLVGHTLGELGFGPSGKADVSVLLIQRGGEFSVNPSMEERVMVGDLLILLGRDDSLGQLLADARSKTPETNGEPSGPPDLA